MASRAHLQFVQSSPDVSAIVNGLNSLRLRIDALVGGHDGIDLSLSPKGNGIDLTIHAKVNSDPSRIAFLLETQPIKDVVFSLVEIRADPKAHHRKLLIAKINAGLSA